MNRGHQAVPNLSNEGKASGTRHRNAFSARLGLKETRRENKLAAYVYLAPALLVYLAFFAYPFIQLVILSFQKWDGIKPKQWVGVANYQRLLFEDPKFWLSVRHNVLWMFAALVVPVLIGLLLATLLYRSPLRGKVIFRTPLLHASGAVLGGRRPDLELDIQPQFWRTE